MLSLLAARLIGWSGPLVAPAEANDEILHPARYTPQRFILGVCLGLGG